MKQASHRRQHRRWWASAVAACLVVGTAASAAQELVVGQVLPLSGPWARTGADMRAGSEACVAWVNRRGGVAGATLRLLTRDDGGQPERSLQAARELVAQDGAALLFGPLGADATSAVLPWATREKVAVLGPHSGEQRARQPAWDAGLYLVANHSLEAQKLAGHLASLGVTRVAVLHDTQGPGAGALIALQEALSVAGLSPGAQWPVGPGALAPAEALQQALQGAPQALVLGTSGATTVALLKAWSQRPERRQLYGVFGLSFTATTAELQSLGEAARGLVITQVLPDALDQRQRLALDYRAALREAGANSPPSAEGLAGCLPALVLAQAMRGRGLPANRSQWARSLREAGPVRMGDLEMQPGDRYMKGSAYVDLATWSLDGRLRR